MTPPANLAEIWLELDLQVKEAIEKRDLIAAELIASMEPGGEAHTPAGGVRLMRPMARFDSALAMKAIPVDQMHQVIKTEISGALVKQFLPEVYDRCRKVVGSPFLKRI